MSKPAEIVASIDDLLTQILLRLPIKSLISFKSVSKHWLSLISDPKFCCLSNPVPNPATGFFLNIPGLQRYEYIPFCPQKPCNAPSISLNEGCSIFHSCNGLLLCGGNSIADHKFNFYVYNPTTNCIAALPELGTGLPRSVTLAFDPVRSVHYKVVTVVGLIGSSKDCPYQIEIYSSETGVWSIAGEIERGRVQFGKGVYWNGSVHWISNRVTENSLRFHVDNRVLDEMPTPPVHRALYWIDNCYFGESCDHLHYIEPGPHFNVYELKKDYSEWFVKYFVDLSPVIVAYPEVIKDHYYYVLSILSLVGGEKEEDSILIMRIPGKAIKLNLVDGSLEKLCEFEGDELKPRPDILMQMDLNTFSPFVVFSSDWSVSIF